MKQKIFLAIVFGSILLFGIFKSFDSGRILFVYPSKEKYPIRGIDVSNHQGKIDWTQIPKSEISFVYIKASEGGDFKDKSFRYNWEEAKKAGLKVGAYHFFTLCRNGNEQADNFIATVPKETNSLPPVLDLEFTGNCKDRPKIENVQKEIQEYLYKVDSHYGTKTILYLTFEFIHQYIGTGFQEYPIWIRDIFKHPNTFSDIRWILWQYSSRGRVDGIQVPVDLNVLNGNIEIFISDSEKNRSKN
ncbi:GH25 family lysozyme [Leptospira sp. WS92.C1]